MSTLASANRRLVLIYGCKYFFNCFHILGWQKTLDSFIATVVYSSLHTLVGKKLCACRPAYTYRRVCEVYTCRRVPCVDCLPTRKFLVIIGRDCPFFVLLKSLFVR